MPKTTYCQNCIEEFDALVLYRGHWVCEPCMERMKVKEDVEEAVVPSWEHTDKSLQVRQLAPGEALPEARASFNFGTQSRGVETSPFSLDVGLRWKDREGK